MAPNPTTREVGHSRGTVFSVSRIARVVIDWYRGKAKVNRPPASAPPGVPPKIPMIGESTCRLPYEIVEMIVSHLKDIKALKACSLTCHSWHTAAVPHIYHILILKERTPGDARNKLNLLSGLHGLGLTPHVKEIRVRECFSTHWFVPEAFSPLDLGYFSALANVHTLKLEELEIHRFVPGIEHYFGHFSQTLRSITLYDPRCTPRQLSHFLSLFPNLDDIEIWYISTHIPHTIIPDTELVPFSAPKLRGQLTLCDFRCPETWTDLITSCGGLRFRHMDLRRVTGCASVLLGACAETLETLRFYPTDGSIGILTLSSPEFNLSRLKALRSLEIGDWTGDFGGGGGCYTIVMEIFSTITSPVFSELVIAIEHNEIGYLSSDAALFRTLRTMNRVRPFKLVFLAEIGEFDRHLGRLEESRWRLEGALSSATTKGLLDFLDSPPTIRTGRLPDLGWETRC